jgi:hypothetical protein
MVPEEIKQKITEWAQKHGAIDEVSISEFKDAELLERKAVDLIVRYCENQAYLINGFPTEIRKRYENDEMSDDKYDADYFCEERYQLYLDLLTLEKNEVAELTWHYTRSFWPEQFESKQAYLEHIKECIESESFYDVSL